MAYSKALVATMTVPITASQTTYGAAVAGFDDFECIKGVATLTGVSAATLNMYIQHSWDGGTTWYDCVAFPQLASGAGTVKYDFNLSLDSTIRAIGSGTVSSAAPVLTANTVVPGPWGNIIRLVSRTGAGTSAAGVDQTVAFLSWRTKH